MAIEIRLRRPAPTNEGERGPSQGRTSVATRATWALVALGLVAASALATSTYSAAKSRSERSFRASASSLSSALATSLRRNEDFVLFQQGLLSAFPDLSNSQYSKAIGGPDVAERYPGGLGFSFIARVAGADLRRFAEDQAEDPEPGVATPSPARFKPFPPGRRPVYCLDRTGWSSGALKGTDASLVATFDFCAKLPTSPFPRVLTRAARLDSLVVMPPMSWYPGVFYLVAPVYRAGAVPSTQAERERDVVGWVLGTYSGEKTLTAALGNISGFEVHLSYKPSGGKATALVSVGKTVRGSTYTSSLSAGSGGRWLLSVVGTTSSGALTGALVQFLLALGVTGLLFAFVRVLVGSRERALALVDERTCELRHLALHDALTGLPNRALITDRAGQMLARANREPLTVGALFIDIDNFKEVNDGFGHQRGDQLLRGVAGRLQEAVRAVDSVGRISGDEFVVLVEGTSVDAGPDVVAQRLLEVLKEPFVLEGMPDFPLNVRASIGVAIGARSCADELLRDADVALYEAKEAGKSRYAIFRPEMQTAVQERLALEVDLRNALDGGGQLFVEYQPTFHLGTMEMAGAEALARWEHPTRGLIGPSTFIPIAEDNGLIVQLGRQVLAESCRQAAAWEAAGLALPVAVNMSGRQLEYEGLADDVALALSKSGLSPDLLTLEVTETVLMHGSDRLSAQLEALKNLGVKLAVDDFGTGYSSLTYLRRYPVDTLKIDRSFIAGIALSPESRAIVHMLIDLGARFELDVLAEGVEDQAQLTGLRQANCDFGQGFYYSRPISADQVEQLWREKARLAPLPY